MNKKDLVGKRFGRLVVQKETEGRRNKNNKLYRMWECLCDCGKTTAVETYSLTSGNTKSCGHCKEPASQVGNRFGKLTVLAPVEGTYKLHYNTNVNYPSHKCNGLASTL